MKTWFVCILAALLIMGCAAPAALAPDFDAAAIGEQAAAVIALANAGDYEGICACLREDLSDALDAAKLEAGWGPVLARAGAFKKLAKLSLYGTTDGKTGEDYAVVVARCRYAGGRLTYTLSFDRDGALVGLYLK